PVRPTGRRAGRAAPATPLSLDQRSRHRWEFERTAAQMRVAPGAELDRLALAGDAHGPGSEVAGQLERPAAHHQPAGALVVLDLARGAAGELLARHDQLAVQAAQALIGAAGELGALERPRVLGVGDLGGELGEGGEL